MSEFDNTVKKHWFMVSFKIHHANNRITEGHRAGLASDRRELNSNDIRQICEWIAEDIKKDCHQPITLKDVLITSMFYMGEMTDADYYEGLESEGEE